MVYVNVIQGGPTTKKKSGKSEGEVTKANGFSIHARQNGSAARSLLGQNHSLSTEMSKVGRLLTKCIFGIVLYLHLF